MKAEWILAGLGMLLATCAFICAGSVMWIRVKRETLTSLKMTKDAAPVRILHLTDLHNRSAHKISLNIWPKIASLNFDIVALTGDLIVSDLAQINPHLMHLQALAARVPVFYVNGNHEHERHCADAMKKRLETIGVRVLYNARQEIVVNGMGITVVGLRDSSFSERRNFEVIEPIFSNIEPNRFILTLIHQPQLFDGLVRHKPDLVLAGHTHGGQIRLPFLPTLFSPHQGFLPKYGDGWYTRDESHLYVSRGIGATYFPLRFWNRPEITVITVWGGAQCSN